MNKWQLFRLLRRNTNLSYKRSAAFEQNQWARLLMYIGGGFFALYLIIYGTTIGFAAEGEAGTITSFMVLILPIDFLLRFIFQTTPAMMAKPYILLPISRYSAIECFLLSSHISGYNFLWLAMFLPYTVIVLAGGATIGAALIALGISLLFIILNSQVYLFFRTLVNRNILWIVPAIILYALPLLPLAIDTKGKSFSRMLDAIQEHGADWWMLPLIISLMGTLFFINRHFQFKYVYEEISRKSEKELKRISSFAFLDRFGIVGEYMKLEVKSNLRNKVMRSRCIMSLSLVIIFSLLVAYTPVYDNPIMINFWCIYCFAIYSMTSLIKVMGQEGNYIDLLMVHHESILSILEAKYWFYCAVLLVPLAIWIPAIFAGKVTLLMLLAYMLLTAGLVHFIIFQLAVYNKQTLPLQQKITGKGNFENGMQIVIEIAAMMIPGAIVAIGYLTVGLTATYLFMCFIGLALMVTSRLWLRNIYNRMMQRRYENLEGFRDSR